MRVANVSRLKQFSDLLPGGEDNGKITCSDVKQIISEVYHRRLINFKRASLVQVGIDDTWEADLLDLKQLTSSNGGKRYCLVVICIFSKFLWLRGLKNKNATSVTAAMSNILIESKRKCRLLGVDRGKEFWNSQFQQLLKSYDIKMYSSFSNVKCSVVERVNRSIRSIIMRYLHEHGTSKWIDKLQYFAGYYNNRHHSTIKMPPIECNTKEKERAILKNIYKKQHLKRCEHPKFRVGDAVRLSLYRKLFQKESDGSFTYEIFYVSQILSQFHPCTYKLINSNKQPILGRVYEEELVKVKRPSLYLIDKVVKRQGDQVLVRFKGMSEHADQWMNEKDICELKCEE